MEMKGKGKMQAGEEASRPPQRPDESTRTADGEGGPKDFTASGGLLYREVPRREQPPPKVVLVFGEEGLYFKTLDENGLRVADDAEVAPPEVDENGLRVADAAEVAPPPCPPPGGASSCSQPAQPQVGMAGPIPQSLQQQRPGASSFSQPVQPPMAPACLSTTNSAPQPTVAPVGAEAAGASSSGGRLVVVEDVWAETSYRAFSEISDLLRSGGADARFVIGIDSEFAIPDGVVLSASEPPTADLHYQQLRAMVNGGDLVQVGISVSDGGYILLGAWQINIYFESSWRRREHAGLEFLQDRAKLKLEDHARHGVPAAHFIEWLAGSGMVRNTRLTWITFMGYPDFGFLVRLLAGLDTLPANRLEFLNRFWEMFPRSYDVRVFTKLGRCRKQVIRGGLEKVCSALGVEPVGKAHNAGSDALSAVLCLEKMRQDPEFARRMARYSGVLYGVVNDFHIHD